MYRKLIIIPLLLLSFILYSQENGAVTPTIAMLKFKAVGVDDVLVNGIEENLLNQLIKQKKFTVVERSQLNQVLEELNLTSSDDFSDAKAVEIGNLLGAESIIVGSVTKLGDSITINVRGIDVKTGIAVFAEDKTTESEKELVAVIKELATLIGNTTIVVDEKTEEIKEEDLSHLNNDIKAKLSPLNISGIALVSAGALVSITGAVLTIYDNAYYNPQYLPSLKTDDASLDEYNSAVDVDAALFAGGIASLSIGICMVAASIPLMVYKKKNNTVSFYLESGNELEIGFSYKF